MTELSNAVTVLIARMESHPEDFNTTGFGKPKFRDVADALYGLAGLDKERAGSYWFLTDADKEALIEAWKKYHRAEMERAVMSTIFDDGAEERERELEKSKMRHQMQQMMAQNTLLQGSSYPYAVSAQQNTGIMGSGGHTGMTVSANGAVNMANTLSLGGETIDSSLLKKLKALVK